MLSQTASCFHFWCWVDENLTLLTTMKSSGAIMDCLAELFQTRASAEAIRLGWEVCNNLWLAFEEEEGGTESKHFDLYSLNSDRTALASSSVC